jgi:hypothetical protein
MKPFPILRFICVHVVPSHTLILTLYSRFERHISYHDEAYFVARVVYICILSIVAAFFRKASSEQCHR